MGFVPQQLALFTSSTFGRSGAQVFFVISGFVIPYALQASGYRVRDYGRFLLKRLARLEPPYIAAICLSLLIAAYHTWVDGDRFPYSVPQVLVHLGYLNMFFRYEWISPVFWTLGVELQYYLAIGLLFPLLLHPKVFWSVVAPLCILVANRHQREWWLILVWLPFFLLGIAAFHYRRRLINGWVFAAAIVLPTVYALLASGRFTAFACAATVIIIAKVPASVTIHRPLVWLGTISYSLYLIHFAVGSVVGNAIVRTFPGTPPLMVVLVSLAGCLIAAWGFYRLVELPSIRFSKRIRYRAAPRTAKGPSGLNHAIEGSTVAARESS